MILNNMKINIYLYIEQLEVGKVRPTKSNISIKLFSFVWVPLADESISEIDEIELV